MAWTSSTRKARRAGSGWQEQALHRRILARYHGICHVCGKPGADQVDHVIPISQRPDLATDERNLRPIHAEPCHRAKTQTEAQRARPSRRRTATPHPGRLG